MCRSWSKLEIKKMRREHICKYVTEYIFFKDTQPLDILRFVGHVASTTTEYHRSILHRGINNSRFSDILFFETQTLSLWHSPFALHFATKRTRIICIALELEGRSESNVRRWRALNEVESTTKDFFFHRSTFKEGFDLHSVKEAQTVGFRKVDWSFSFVLRMLHSSLSRSGQRNGFCFFERT